MIEGDPDPRRLHPRDPRANKPYPAQIDGQRLARHEPLIRFSHHTAGGQVSHPQRRVGPVLSRYPRLKEHAVALRDPLMRARCIILFALETGKIFHCDTPPCA